MKITLIRHGKTKGNLKRQYIGRTDESLCGEGRKSLEILAGKGIYPDCELVYSSSMLRCLETATILYPDQRVIPMDALRECDFGDFEGKTYEDLKDNPAYRRFLDNNAAGEIPNGENTEAFKERSQKAFLQIVEQAQEQGLVSAAIICHGGSIMAIMERFDTRQRSFYDYQVKNGLGFSGVFDFGLQKMCNVEEITD